MKTRIFTLIMSLFIATMAFAYEAEIDGIYYDFDHENKTATVTYGGWDDETGGSLYTQSEIIISEKVSYNGVEYSVTSIGIGAFSDCSSLTSITIGNSVTSIGDYAFNGCSSLISIEIPNSVIEIGNYVFNGCTGLTSIEVDDNQNYASVEGILFNKNITILICCPQGKTSIEIPNSVTSIGSFAFENCSSLTSIIIPNSVTSIGDYAFYGCTGLTSIVIPNSVIEIGEFVFNGCTGLTSITIGENVTSIGDRPFIGCNNLTTVVWNAINYHTDDHTNFLFCINFYGYDENYELCPITTFTFGDKIEYIPANLLNGLSKITSITIGENVTLIENRAFVGCHNLTTVVWNAIKCNISKYNDYSPFYGEYYDYDIDAYVKSVCPIKTFTFGDKVEYIPNYLCSELGEITSITIPNSVTSIGYNAFRGCSSLTSVHISSIAAWCNIDFDSWNSLLHNSKNLYLNGEKVTDLIIPEGVDSIKDYVFCGLETLTFVTMPNSVTFIGEEAFRGCSGLTSIEIPNSVTSIENYAFRDCIGLKYAKIGSGVKEINERIFYCDEFYDGESDRYIPIVSPLDTLICEFGDDVVLYFDEYPGEGTEHPLVGVKSLRYFEGPAKVLNTIDEEFQAQFSNKLTEVHITDGELDENGFNYINRSKKSLHTIDLAGTTNTAINDLAFYDCYKLENLMLPGNLETIGFKAVAECYQLKGINIPASVVEINDAAFENCRSIKSITFGGQAEAKSFASRMNRAAASGDVALQRIGNWAFYNCHALENLVIPEGVTEVGDAAFYGCTYLDSLALPSTTQRIGDNCFALCSRMKQINVNATVPPTIFAKTFFDVNRNIPVIVPEGAREAYANDEYWGEFINVVESDDVDTQIENAENANVAIYSVGGVLYVDGLSADYQVFDVNGRLVYTGRDAQLTLPRGVYVVAIEGEVEKIVL